MLDIVIILLILYYLYVSNIKICLKFKINELRRDQLHLLLLYHFIFTIIFTLYILAFKGDSYSYWHFSNIQLKRWEHLSFFEIYGTSTKFIAFLNFIPFKYCHLNYFTGNLLYSALGFMGIRYLFVLTYSYFPYNFKVYNFNIFPLVFFLPNLHFWTSGVGKDALVFYGIAIFLFALINPKLYWFKLFFGIVLVYHVRPHISFLLLGSTLISFLFESKLKISSKILYVSLIAAFLFLINDKVLNFLGIEDYSLNTLEGLADFQASHLNKERIGSSFNLSNYSYLYKIFTYLFRPLFYDAHNFFSLISSIENLIYLSILIWYLKNFNLKSIQILPRFLKSGLLFFLFASIAFSTSLSNLGIAMRMKNMTLIYFILFCLFSISINKRREILYRIKNQ
jgi:hypothetical protein